MPQVNVPSATVRTVMLRGACAYLTRCQGKTGKFCKPEEAQVEQQKYSKTLEMRPRIQIGFASRGLLRSSPSSVAFKQ